MLAAKAPVGHMWGQAEVEGNTLERSFGYCCTGMQLQSVPEVAVAMVEVMMLQCVCLSQ